MIAKMMTTASRLLLLSAAVLITLPAQAGIMASSTRVIYEQGQNERSLMLANINAYPVVVQTWVNEGEDQQTPENSTSPLITLPSVFRMQAGAVQGLRIVHNGDALPSDRESVFWLNLYEIAPKAANKSAEQTSVALAMNTQMKIFYRPKNLPSLPQDMAKSLSFKLEKQGDQWQLVLRNPTPYHASLASLKLIDQGREMAIPPLPEMMALPLSEKRYPLASNSLVSPADLKVNFTWIDDGGHFQTMTTPLLTP